MYLIRQKPVEIQTREEKVRLLRFSGLFQEIFRSKFILLYED